MSLATRLSAFFLAMLGMVLLGFSLALYLLAWAYLHRQVDERLGAALEALAVCIENENDGLEWDPNLRHLTLGRDAGIEQVRWELRDSHGQVVDRSANLARGDLLQQIGPGGEEGTWSVNNTGSPWRLARRTLHFVPRAAPFPPSAALVEQGPPQPRYQTLVITAGLSLEPLETTLRSLGVTLAGLSAILWLTAAVLGRWLCRRGLAPMAHMADAALDMGAADLGQRLPDPGTGDELGALHRSFNGLLDRLQEAFERQRQFTGNASHQLRTPLTAMQGQVELALRRDRSSEEYRRTLDQIQGQAARLGRIVEALLFLARADTEAELSVLEAIDLTAWLAQHLGTWADHPRRADLHLHDAAHGSCTVKAQPLLLGQLLDNLLDNALKYSEPGSAVTISLRHEDGMAVLAVEDAGHGFAPEELPHVVEPFFRSPEARRRGLPGVGLGLAVAQRIATALGGRLTVTSTQGRGSCFSLHLPAN